jgi:8-amino-7-oxononanoate synthase
LKRGGELFGLSAANKARLLERLSSRADNAPRPDIAALPGSREMRLVAAAADHLGIPDPFFREHEGIAGAETIVDGRAYVNFASYDYLALNGDQRIAEAAKAAIDRYGTTVWTRSVSSAATRPMSR